MGRPSEHSAVAKLQGILIAEDSVAMLVGDCGFDPESVVMTRKAILEHFERLVKEAALRQQSQSLASTSGNGRSKPAMKRGRRKA